MSPGMSLQNFDVCWRLNHFFRSKVREMCSRKRLETGPRLETVDRGHMLVVVGRGLYTWETTAVSFLAVRGSGGEVTKNITISIH
jgi:hypothetical protein